MGASTIVFSTRILVLVTLSAPSEDILEEGELSDDDDNDDDDGGGGGSGRNRLSGMRTTAPMQIPRGSRNLAAVEFASSPTPILLSLFLVSLFAVCSLSCIVGPPSLNPGLPTTPATVLCVYMYVIVSICACMSNRINCENIRLKVPIDPMPHSHTHTSGHK